MNKILVGILVTGAAVAAGYAAVKLLKGKDSQPDYDDDIYDYPDPYDTDESIDFEINDDSAVKDLAEDAADKAEDIIRQVSSKGTKVYILADGMPVNSKSHTHRFLGVETQAIEFDNGFPTLRTKKLGNFEVALFPDEYRHWKICK